MILLRILFNALVVAIEIGLIVGIATLAYYQPIVFAGVTVLVAFVFGLSLERARIAHEMPFYFGHAPARAGLMATLIASGSAAFKAVIAGLIALLMFAGTDTGRLFWIAIIVGVCIFAGTSILRRLSISFDAPPSRWGYFRLAVPLGLLYAIGQSFLPTPSFVELGRRLTFELPSRPSLSQAAEFLFLLQQKFDETVVSLLGVLFDPPVAQALGVLISTNVIAGFMIAVYAAIIAELVEWLEKAAG